MVMKYKKIGQIAKLMSGFKLKTGIRRQLVFMLLSVSLACMFTLMALSYNSGKENLSDRILNQLTSLRSARAAQVSAYFDGLRTQVETLSEDWMVINAMRDLKAAYKKIEKIPMPSYWERKLDQYYNEEIIPYMPKTPEGKPLIEITPPTQSGNRYLQYHYLANNPNNYNTHYLTTDPGDDSDYTKAHTRYHPLFREIQERFDYADIILVDAETNTTIYSYAKQIDFAVDLTTGSFKETNLAEAVNDAIQGKAKNYSKIVDYKQYPASFGAPTTFIAAPIFDKSELIGVLALQIYDTDLNKIMTGNKNWEKDGLGKTGQTYLVGQDSTMRSISRFLIEDKKKFLENLKSADVEEKITNAIEKYQTTIILLKIDSEAASNGLSGKTGTQILADSRNIKVLSSYSPLEVGGLGWAIVAEIDLAEAYKPVQEFTRFVLLWGLILAVIVTIVAVIISGVFIKPIQKIIASAQKIGSGDMNALVDISSRDEFGELAESFNTMVQSLQTQTKMIEQKNQENEDLLLSVFPASVTERLKNKDEIIADHIDNVTILFADIIGFGKLYQSMTVEEVLGAINDLIGLFDSALPTYEVDKIKTIGDNYIAAVGITGTSPNHSLSAISFAMEMRNIIRQFNRDKGLHLDICIGINSGDVFAGIVGRRKLTYDVWGRTVSIASAILLAAEKIPGSILVSQTVYDSLEDLYQFEPVEDDDFRGNLWILKGARG